MKNKILLVEDDHTLRKNFHELLELYGFSVDSVENGLFGIEALKKQTYDLVISDIMMPGLDGYGLVSYIRNIKELSNLPIILLTAKTEKEDIRHGMASGADDYITKPVLIKDLLKAIDSVLTKKRQREEYLQQSLQQALEYERKVKFHELRTPLFGLISLLSFLEEHIESLTLKELTEFILNAKKAALNLNKSLLKLKNYVELKHIEMKQEQIHQLQELLCLAIDRAGLNKSYSIEGELTSFLFDKNSLEFILEELLENADKFRIADTIINIKISDNIIHIENSQSHIPFDTKINIDPFNQFDRIRNEQQGLGLGLYLCEKYAIKNNAEFTAYTCVNGRFNVVLKVNQGLVGA